MSANVRKIWKKIQTPNSLVPGGGPVCIMLSPTFECFSTRVVYPLGVKDDLKGSIEQIFGFLNISIDDVGYWLVLLWGDGGTPLSPPVGKVPMDLKKYLLFLRPMGCLQLKKTLRPRGQGNAYRTTLWDCLGPYFLHLPYSRGLNTSPVAQKVEHLP